VGHCNVVFQPEERTVAVRVGTLVTEAARQAGLDLNMPCGGQGRCGRCAVIVQDGTVRRRSTLRLSQADLAAGYALACQTVIEGDTVVLIPPQERIERRLTTDKTAARIALPFPYDAGRDQPLRKLVVTLPPPSYADNTDDWSRLQKELATRHGLRHVITSLPVLRKLGKALRDGDWQVTVVVELDTWDRPAGRPRIVDVLPGIQMDTFYGLAIDIGTTSNVVYLVDLLTGEVVDQAADYNAQIKRGEDVISRIIYASRKDGTGLGEMQQLVVNTLNGLIDRVCRRRRIEPADIVKATVAGNTTMLHLFLAIPPEPIRLSPFIPTVNHMPTVPARELGLKINPEATVDCLPNVASYVGADITAGVVSSGLTETDRLTLFLDVGTNGETVLGTADWLITCACSAGPAFEGAGVLHGMRATTGAIEEVWINSQTLEPTYRVIGGGKPRGICGSGLISLLAEMFITDVIDKAGNIKLEESKGAKGPEGAKGPKGPKGTKGIEGTDVPSDLSGPSDPSGSFVPSAPFSRVRQGEHGGEYVVAWADETETGQDIVITKVDIDNLLRAKAAIYAGFSVLAHSVGVSLADVEQVLIGGAFGQYINVEKAVQIGLLPDMPWERFHFLGNTSVRGAYMALLSRDARQRIADAARKMTYLELSADNTFYNEFTSALFLPHTDITKFPSVAEILDDTVTR
jgi:uncharacterized 2Fe-2S/4Fe-4S cluster protein (DUF4445 family)